jgi:hypothetical protein
MKMGELNKDLDHLAKNGTFSIAFSKTHMLTVNEALDIDRVRFSIVRLGTEGQEYREFFLETREMNRLCDEVLNGRAEARIEADKDHTIGAYRFVAGEGGAQVLSISKGKVGILVQISDRIDDRAAWYVPIRFADLYDIAFMYRLLTGLINVREDSYYGYLQQVFQLGRKERNEEYLKKLEEETQEKNEESQEESEVVANPDLCSYNVVLYGKSKVNKGFWSIPGIEASTNEQVQVLFRQDGSVNADAVQELANKAAQEATSFYFIGEKRQNYILYYDDLAADED